MCDDAYIQRFMTATQREFEHAAVLAAAAVPGIGAERMRQDLIHHLSAMSNAAPIDISVWVGAYALGWVAGQNHR